MGLIECALTRLRQPEAVRSQVLAYLFISRIHNVIKSSYDLFQPPDCNQHCQEETTLTKNGGWLGEHQAQDPSSAQQRATLGVPWHRKRTIKLHTRKLLRKDRHTNQVIKEPLASERTGLHHHQQQQQHAWDWHGFPNARSRPLALWDLITMSWMVWAGLREPFCEQLAAFVSPLSRWLFGLPGNCLLLGRLAVPPSLSQLTSLVLSAYHLCWRLVQGRAKRNRLITAIVFLLASERDLGRAYEQLERDKWARRDNDPKLRLFRHVMCYRVHLNERFYFKLRPNRTRAACEKLRNRTALVTLTTVAFFGSIFVVCLGLAFLAVISDYRYVYVYPGCYPLLDEQLARGQLSLFSITLKNHHLISSLFDAVENFSLWVNSGLSLIFVPAFAYLLNYDLLLYWSALDKKIRLLAERSRWANTTTTIQQLGVVVVSKRNKIKISELPVSNTSAGLSSAPRTNNCYALASPPGTLEADIHELQFEMSDFFHQVRKTDLFVGDVLTAAILIWLAGCAFIAYKQLDSNDSSLISALLVQLLLVLSFYVITLFTYNLLKLRHRCLGSYQVICSLMAYDQTAQKRHSTKLMEFYVHNSASYHLGRMYSYKPTTFITIVGWTFSCFSIAFTLFKPAR